MTDALERLCGQLIVGGFEGIALPSQLSDALQRGWRAGVILFKRNLVGLDQAHELCRSIAEGAPDAFVSVDQEGGRVQRLGRPVLQLPPMRRFAERATLALLGQAAAELGRQLACIGFNLNFAPVLDVDSNPSNPVIGDRAFGPQPAQVVRFGRTVADALEAQGVLSCGKHFPGHGDTDRDSHFELPFVSHSRERLNAIEFEPFRQLGPRLGAIMSAHVVYEAFSESEPATIVPELATTLLRQGCGFRGVLFSDDLEMRAVADLLTIEELAVRAVRAGCDVLLICKSLEKQQRAHHALVVECERDAAFRRRCDEAAERSVAARRAFPSRPSAAFEAVVRLCRRPEAARLQEQLDRL